MALFSLLLCFRSLQTLLSLSCPHPPDLEYINIGDESGIVTISDGNLNGKIQRQAYSGPVRALVLAPEGTPPVAGASRTYPLPSNATFTSATAGAGTSTFRSGNSKKAIGVVVTLGDDSVNPSAASYGNPIAASAGTGTGAATALTSGSGNASTVGVGAVGNGRSPCVLKFWAGTDMAVCIRAVDVALQFGDGQDSKLATTAGRAGGGSARAGRLPRLTAFAVTPDATQVPPCRAYEVPSGITRPFCHLS